jgi:hypothetical protein
VLTWSEQTLGQLIYTLVMANPDGLGPEGLIARVQECQHGVSREEILNKATLLQAYECIRQDNGRWYAPGPTPAVWQEL